MEDSEERDVTVVHGVVVALDVVDEEVAEDVVVVEDDVAVVVCEPSDTPGYTVARTVLVTVGSAAFTTVFVWVAIDVTI